MISKITNLDLECISLIFTYCLFVEKELVTIKHSLLNFSGGGEGVKMCDTMTISAYILKIVEKDPFLRLQMRAKESLTVTNFFSTNKQYVKIKLMKNETNLWSKYFFGKDEILAKL